jgi:hypothetical protein
MLKIILFVGFMALLSIASVETLQCWFCARTKEEFGLRLKDNCRNVTCPSGTRCYVEMYKCKWTNYLVRVECVTNLITAKFPRHTKSLRGCSPHKDCRRSNGAHCRLCSKNLCNAEIEKYFIGWIRVNKGKYLLNVCSVKSY